MKRVGIVSSRKWANILEEDKEIKELLIKDGYDASIEAWQDIKACEYDALFLRSAWGYHKEYEDFKLWLEYLKECNIPIYNSVDLIMNNIQKDKQFNILKKYNIPVIDTKIISSVEELSDDDYGSVIKPSISGSGDNTIIYNADTDISILSSLLDNADKKLLVQPFIKSVEDGEYAICYIDGINTHNMVRHPGIFYDFKKPYQVLDVNEKVLDLASKIENIPEFNGYLYMRIDIVLIDGNPYVMEVEMAEPDLLTKYMNDDQKLNVRTQIVKSLGVRL